MSKCKVCIADATYSPNMRSIMGFLPVVKEGAKGCPGLKVTDFQTIPIAIPIDMNIFAIYSQYNLI